MTRIIKSKQHLQVLCICCQHDIAWLSLLQPFLSFHVWRTLWPSFWQASKSARCLIATAELEAIDTRKNGTSAQNLTLLTWVYNKSKDIKATSSGNHLLVVEFILRQSLQATFRDSAYKKNMTLIQFKCLETTHYSTKITTVWSPLLS